jgi:hypothetical protein
VEGEPGRGAAGDGGRSETIDGGDRGDTIRRPHRGHAGGGGGGGSEGSWARLMRAVAAARGRQKSRPLHIRNRQTTFAHCCLDGSRPRPGPCPAPTTPPPLLPRSRRALRCASAPSLRPPPVPPHRVASTGALALARPPLAPHPLCVSHRVPCLPCPAGRPPFRLAARPRPSTVPEC